MIKKLWHTWINQRFKVNRYRNLTQKDVLIFIYRQGFLYLVLILITFIAGVNYANNLVLGFCFLISAILCISFYLTFKQLHGLQIEVVMSEVGQVGEPLVLQLFFSQAQRQTHYLWLKVDDCLEKIYFQDQHYQHQIIFLPTKRGAFLYPQIQLYSTYPFGLVRAWTYLNLQEKSWIAPQAEWIQAENKQHQTQFIPDLDEFRELRGFQEGDSLQAVSWKHAARGQGLQIKLFEQYQDQHKIEIDYEGMPSTVHETKLSLMMGLVEQCEQRQCAYSLSLPKSQLISGVGIQQLHQSKILLAQA